ncbi:DUF4174 domain-containing protein [Cognatishimia sp. MH4019]|uniref:DUF4174 domain-containing protein n=1 Tax=Cognatishimia sp. MH4019 TaxID=2854030 RepID=UPI001CD7F6A4|nr:DUF4174 domain-containing protein [Cognatishimia sp. MH4019]
MKTLASLVLSVGLIAPAFAEETASTMSVVSPLEAWQDDPTVILNGADVNIDDFKWIARPVIVFATSPADPRFAEQMELLADRVDELMIRDVVVIVDTDDETLSDLRRKLRPRDFMMVLIGKDGGVKLRKPFPYDVRELSRSIDKMPLRQQEIRERRGS